MERPRALFVRLLSLVALATGASACANRPLPPEGFGSRDATADHSSPDDAGTKVAPCPADTPEAGADCDPTVATGPCEYGDDPHCTTVAWCTPDADASATRWSLTPPDPSCAGNPPGCPPAFDAGMGAPCPVAGDCAYPEGLCGCVPCVNVQGGFCVEECSWSDGGADQGIWLCDRWPDCGNPRPRLGTPCDAPASWDCGHLPCYCDAVVAVPGEQCVDGYWNFVQGGC